MTTQKFDAVVVGAGPGGYVAAIRLAQLGKSVALVEREYWGGVCLNIGCIPTKALLKNAEVAQLLKTQAEAFGISGEVSVSYEAAFKRSREVSEGRVKGIHYLTKKNGITEFQGTAYFKSANTMTVTTQTEVVELEFENAIIATGASPRLLPGIERSERVYTYEKQILADQAPKSLVIIGAGAIGVEFSFLLSAYGTEITLIEALDRVLPLEDQETSKEIASQLRKRGVVVKTGAIVESASENPGSVTVTLRDGQEIEAEAVMVSIGFAPNLDGYGLENTGVKISDRRAIEVDDQLRTSVPNLFAIGDVTAKLQLAHVAEAQGVVAAETIAGLNPKGVSDYSSMPRAIFTNPQVASFGLTEEQARERFEPLVSKFSMVANGKAHAIAAPYGFVKLIADPDSRHLVGAHIVSANAADLISELTLAHSAGISIDELNHNVHIHPTLSEGVQEALHGLVGQMINA